MTKSSSPKQIKIAAAPETAAERDELKAVNAELLEALERAAELLSVMEIPRHGVRWRVKQQINAAIARATGESGEGE